MIIISVPVVIIQAVCFLIALVSSWLVNQKHSLTTAQPASSLRDHPRMPLTFVCLFVFPWWAGDGGGHDYSDFTWRCEVYICDSVELWLKNGCHSKPPAEKTALVALLAFTGVCDLVPTCSDPKHHWSYPMCFSPRSSARDWKTI